MKKLKAIIAAIAALFQFSEVAAAERAARHLFDSNENIRKAEQLLASLKAERIERVKADAAVLEAVIADAKAKAEQSEQLRQTEIHTINSETEARIRALEEAIAGARKDATERLSLLAEKQSAARSEEQARLETAEYTLNSLKSVAGSSE